jgi:hypothetical protein
MSPLPGAFSELDEIGNRFGGFLLEEKRDNLPFAGVENRVDSGFTGHVELLLE